MSGKLVNTLRLEEKEKASMIIGKSNLSDGPIMGDMKKCLITIIINENLFKDPTATYNGLRKDLFHMNLESVAEHYNQYHDKSRHHLRP